MTFSIQVFGQSDTLTLSFCHQAALSTSPLSRQEALLSQKIELQNQAACKSNLPVIDLVGRASYQSEVITIPGLTQIPEFPIIPKEQFNVYLDVKQKIYDGNITKVSRSINDAENLAERNQLEIDLDRVKTNINQLFYAALLAQENENILGNIRKTLNTQRAVTQSGVINGLILETALLSIDKELLSIDQQSLHAKSNKTAYLKMLSVWIDQETLDVTHLTLPDYDISQVQEFQGMGSDQIPHHAGAPQQIGGKDVVRPGPADFDFRLPAVGPADDSQVGVELAGRQQQVDVLGIAAQGGDHTLGPPDAGGEEGFVGGGVAHHEQGIPLLEFAQDLLIPFDHHVREIVALQGLTDGVSRAAQGTQAFS